MAKKRNTHHLLTTGHKPESKSRQWLPGFFLALLYAFILIGIVQCDAFIRMHNKGLHPFYLIGLFIIVIVTFALANLYLNKFEHTVKETRKTLITYGALAIGLVLVGRALLYANWSAFLTPCVLAAMVYAIVFNQRFAIITMLVLCLFIAMRFEPVLIGKNPTWPRFVFDFPLFAGCAAGSVAAIFGVAHIRTRSRLISVGFMSGITQFTVIFMASIVAYPAGSWGGRFWTDVLMHSGLGFANAFTCGFLMTGLLPYIEKIFDVTTDLSMIELSDLNQPVLREFSLIAPGTYHHSLRVGQLAEAAAEAVNANPLLARVGSYFHDIGKRAKAEYFTENEMGKGSRHDRLSPALSTLIIISHSKDGVEAAEELGLPQRVIDITAQHHGTSLVEFFYHEAQEEYGENGEAIAEGAFRYPGPKPTFKEAGIILLSDAIEAASRTLDDPSPARIENLVETITNKKLMDKQLDDSKLTLTDLKRIKKSFIRVLMAMFHSRIKYPTTEHELNKKELPEEKKEAQTPTPAPEKQRSDD
ncbi:MAG: HDIG domain-containing protein [Planctomycetota bacterium]|nr:MAG: HDIG domain-containing protein [Planctomycetota bacterium]